MAHEWKKEQAFDTVQQTNLGEGNGTPLQYSCLENPMDRTTEADYDGEMTYSTRKAWGWQLLLGSETKGQTTGHLPHAPALSQHLVAPVF